MVTLATAIVRAWTWLYTSGLDPDPRDDRRAQIASDLWEYADDARSAGVPDAAMAAHIMARLMLGVADDILWRGEQMSAASAMVPISLGQSHAEPFTLRRVSGFGVSATVHVVLLMAAVWVAPHITTAAIRTRISSATIVFVPSADASDGTAPAKRDNRDRVDVPAIVPDDDLGITLGSAGKTVAMPGFTFNFSKVIARAGNLFPFVTGSAGLQRIAAAALLPKEPKRLINPFSRATAGADGLPPLQLSAAEIQALVDRTWARRDRWTAFSPLVGVAGNHSPDEGSLPTLLREYVEQNGLQPYVDAEIRDPRLWTQLGVVADHADFIEFISGYVGRHSATKAATELLFLLDTLVQGSYDTLTALLDIVPEEDLRWTRTANRDAYSAMLTLQQHYRVELESRNLTTRSALRLYFDAARISILSDIVDTTPGGYRVNDARFLIGAIYWRQGRFDEAAAEWRQMHAVAGDRYATSAASILDALNADTTVAASATRIARILDGERGRWISFSHDRLKQFGYRFTIF